VRRVTQRVSRWREADMAKRWAAVGFPEPERRSCRIQSIVIRGSSLKPWDENRKSNVAEQRKAESETFPRRSHLLI
jgi:hypothetical protein